MIHRLIIKILLTSVVVVAISEMAKRSVWLGAILAALPLTLYYLGLKQLGVQL